MWPVSVLVSMTALGLLRRAEPRRWAAYLANSSGNPAAGDSSSCELLAFISEAGKECPDVSSLGAAHQEERVVEVVLRIHTLGYELLADFLPSLLDSFVVTDPYSCGVRRALGQKITRNLIPAFPFVYGICFICFSVGRLVLDFGDGERLRPIRVRPAMHGSHSLLEMHREDSPIDTIRLEARDVGRELFDGGRHGRGSRMRGWSRHCGISSRCCSSSGFRARNLERVMREWNSDFE